MNTTELIAATRRAAFIGNTDPEYTDAVILGLASNMVFNTFSEIMVRSRQGYWRHEYVYTLIAGQKAYRINPRALANALELLEIQLGTGYLKLNYLDPRDVGRLEGQAPQQQPQRYTIDNDTIKLYPTPAVPISMRCLYGLRPSTLYAAQTAGAIASVNAAAYSFTTTTLPNNSLLAAPIATGALVDVVHPAGCFDLGIVGLPATIVLALGVYTWTLPTGTDMTRIAVGDYVRAAEQTDWPQIPVEYHQTLADATATEILLQKGAAQKAATLAGKAQSAIEKMRVLLEPRVKWDPAVLRRRNNMLRRGNWPYFPVAGG